MISIRDNLSTRTWDKKCDIPLYIWKVVVVRDVGRARRNVMKFLASDVAVKEGLSPQPTLLVMAQGINFSNVVHILNRKLVGAFVL